MSILSKIVGILKTAKTVIDLSIPVLEQLMNKDLNNDGKIGR